MKAVALRLAITATVAVLGAPVAHATVPGSMEITCDVDRKTFRSVAKNETQVTFRLWDAQTGGSQCGPDHVVLMKDLVAFKERTDRFDAQRPRKFATLRAVLGSDASPVQLCSGAETWVDVTVGTTTLTCDFSADDDSKNPPPPPARKRLHSVPSAQEGGPTPADISVRVYNSVTIPLLHNVETPLTFDTEVFDTCGMHEPGNPSRLTACTAGKYLIFGDVAFDSTNPTATGFRVLRIRLNGSIPSTVARAAIDVSQSAASHALSIVTYLDLDAGTYVELTAYQNSGGTVDVHVNGNETPVFGMVKLP